MYPVRKLCKTMGYQEQEQYDTLFLEETKTEREYKIILFNDDVNTFDYVIEMLVSICDHTPEQAEQCAMIVHFNGKCPVKTGSYEDLLPRCSALLNGGLTAEIQ